MNISQFVLVFLFAINGAHHTYLEPHHVNRAIVTMQAPYKQRQAKACIMDIHKANGMFRGIDRRRLFDRRK